MVDTAVTSVESGKIILKDGSSVVADTIIWVAGVKPKSPNIEGIELEKSGRIKIDEYLRVKDNVFALGDVSGTLPMLAQVAVQQSKNVAENIIYTISNKPLTPFKFKEKGLLVSLGQWYAAGKISGITLKGPFMWWLWRTIYLFNFHSWRNRVKIAVEWTVNLFSPRDITEI
jgi:NADH dehydrogenase